MDKRTIRSYAAFGAAIAMVAGCSKLLDIEPGTLRPDAGHGGSVAQGQTASSGAGGGQAEGSSSSAMGGAAGSGACVVASDCPAPLHAECRTVACESGVCAYSNTPTGEAVSSQIAGDCHQVECDGEGSIRTALANDPIDDGKECTVDACVQGVAQNSPKIAGTACQQNGGKVCSASGECVGCINAADCPGQICQSNGCVPSSCADGVKNGAETATDCGGSCNPCKDGQPCKVSGDCRSHVCANMVCKAPNCSDGVANGAETDVDCGGFCPPCATGDTCAVDADCQSSVCIGAICQAPKCTDGKKNGAETDIDCGKSCPRCPDGKACSEGSDCTGNLCVGGDCCTAQSASITCASKCGPVINNCGQMVDCGGCAPPDTCVQQKCVCTPEDSTVTCKNKCGDVPNNCGQTVQCTPCDPTGSSSSSSSSSSGGGGAGGSSSSSAAGSGSSGGAMPVCTAGLQAGMELAGGCGPCKSCARDSDCDQSLGLTCKQHVCKPCSNASAD